MVQSAVSADIAVCVLARFVGFLAKEVDVTALCKAFTCTDAIASCLAYLDECQLDDLCCSCLSQNSCHTCD